MNNSKYFVFTVAITAIILLVLGNWVTPVQANNAGIGTPMPTGTPDAIDIPGKIPSAKEQKELKAIVQSYIEVRYRALSISNTEDIKQNRFGRLISGTPKAAAFLSEEMSKLAVEIKRADTYHLRYVVYKYFLDFHSITVDPATQTATILMTEGNEVLYEISAELNPENPIISHTAGIEHTILLRKIQGQWKILSDTYDDDLWKMLRHGGKSTDEILHTSGELIRVLEASPKSLTTRRSNTEALPTYTLPDDPSSHPYDRAGAVEYALQHWKRDAGQYNPNYYPFDQDCQNFVSQAIYEGGNVTMFIPDPDAILTTGDNGWFYLNNLQYAAGWTNVNFFFTRTTLDPSHPSYNLNDQETWPETWRDSYNQGPESVLLGTLNPQVDDLNNANNIPAELEPGDIILYEWGYSEGNPETDQIYDHSALVVAKEGGFPFIAAHTDDHYGIPYTQTVNPIEEVRFIHIALCDYNDETLVPIQVN